MLVVGDLLKDVIVRKEVSNSCYFSSFIAVALLSVNDSVVNNLCSLSARHGA